MIVHRRDFGRVADWLKKHGAVVSSDELEVFIDHVDIAYEASSLSSDFDQSTKGHSLSRLTAQLDKCIELASTRANWNRIYLFASDDTTFIDPITALAQLRERVVAAQRGKQSGRPTNEPLYAMLRVIADFLKTRTGKRITSKAGGAFAAEVAKVVAPGAVKKLPNGIRLFAERQKKKPAKGRPRVR
jgi:hypothetical protein